MFRRFDETSGVNPSVNERVRSRVVLAGPGTTLTTPGIIVSQMAAAIGRIATLTRIEVDHDRRVTAGLHRAPSLAAVHDAPLDTSIVTRQAPYEAQARKHAFREWIGKDDQLAIAYAWPGIDNAWIRQFLQTARAAGLLSVVACASLPRAHTSRPVSLADLIVGADVVIVGESSDADELTATFGMKGPVVETHRALSLGGRDDRSSVRQITAFSPRGNQTSLASLLAAFDAIPQAEIEGYRLQVLMRYDSSDIPAMVDDSHHGRHVQLIGDRMSALDLEKMCASSSALSIAEPAFDSRAFSTAVDCGIATVVLADSLVPEVGRGYAGGLLANVHRPASVHVGLEHALRLEEFGFPSPKAWEELATHLGDKLIRTNPAVLAAAPAQEDDLVRALQSG